MLRPVLAACVLALAASSELPSSRQGMRQPRSRARRAPPLAFVTSELTFELPASELTDGRPQLIWFRGKGDDYCAQMKPLVEQLTKELDVEVRVFEVWYDTKNVALLQKLDKGRCGGVPFFYNKRTRRFICGATTYDNLKTWALDEICEPFLPPPNINQKQEPNEMQGKMGEFVQKIKAKAQEKMALMEARKGGGGGRSATQ